VFFANFFQTAFGNSGDNDSRDYSTIHIYSEFKDLNEQVPVREIDVYHPTLFPNAIANLQQIVQVQHDQGMRYMRVGTKGHTENIDIDRLLSLDLGKMKDGDIYWIVDRNWIGNFMDIALIAIKKTMDYNKNPPVPQYEFVLVHNAERSGYELLFRVVNLWYFRVFTTEVRKYEATETT
jgi:hypothetical protein